MATTATDHPLLIDGERVETGEWTEVRSPFSGDLVGRIHEAQGRRRNDRLLHRDPRVTQGDIEVTISRDLIVKGSFGQPGHMAHVAGGKGDFETVR